MQRVHFFSRDLWRPDHNLSICCFLRSWNVRHKGTAFNTCQSCNLNVLVSEVSRLVGSWNTRIVQWHGIVQRCDQRIGRGVCVRCVGWQNKPSHSTYPVLLIEFRLL